MISQQSLSQLLEEVYQHAVGEHGDKLDSVILYGSYARGEADPESDVDIMILVNEDRSTLAHHRYAWNQFGTVLDLKYDVLTSFHLQDAQSFNDWKETLPFYRNISREGVKISA